MRPMDIFSEKSSIRDGRLDKACSSALVYEAHSLSLQSQFHKADSKHDPKNPNGKVVEGDFNSAVGFGKRDQMALASLVFCNPLMMLGMGAALGVSDTMRMNREQALKEAPMRRLRQVISERREEQPKERTLLSVPTDSIATRMNFKPEATTRKSKLEFKNRQDNIMYPSEFRKPDPERSWVKASKLLKRKQQLADQLAKCRGFLPLNMVSALAAKIELLDKELKKMGC
jgi:hypothetical protein